MASSSAFFPLFFAFISREIRKTVWVHCQVHLGQLTSPRATFFSEPREAAQPQLAIFGCAGRQAFQRAVFTNVLARWWKWSGHEFLRALKSQHHGSSLEPAVTSSAPWLRIPNWSFSWCLYTKLVNYENLSTAFSYWKISICTWYVPHFEWDAKLSHI